MNYRLFLSTLALIPFGAANAQTLQATPWVSGLSQPVVIVQDPTNQSVQFIVQQGGAIRVSVGGVLQTPNFLNISVLTGSERGLLGLCFDPDYATNGYFYINYTRPGVFMQLSRFSRSANPLIADPSSELRILRTQRPFTNHNSGNIAFGPDKFLYMPTGDGGSAGDPGNRAQNPNELLGKMLRIDPTSDDFPGDPEANYHIPADNPFVDNLPITARHEIWAFGYRNPWKFSFDDPTKLGTGAMVAADVGQDAIEEIDYEPAGQGGRNYGWSRFEGNNLFNNSRSLAYGPHQTPLHTYTHAFGSSVTGGYVYRGLQLGPEYFGRYFFADFVSGRVWIAGLIIDPNTGEATTNGIVEKTSDFGGQLGNISSFGVDAEGELFALNFGGSAYRITRPNTTWLTDAGRTNGIITSGQVRSLIAQDTKLLEMQHFSAFFTTNRSTALLVGAKSNVVGGTTIDVSFVAKANQAINIPGQLLVKNWTTGLFELVTNFSLNGTFQTVAGSIGSTDHVDPASGRMEFKSTTLFSGILLSATLKIQYDLVTVAVR